jgi:hypothetical protein
VVVRFRLRLGLYKGFQNFMTQYTKTDKVCQTTSKLPNVIKYIKWP